MPSQLAICYFVFPQVLFKRVQGLLQPTTLLLAETGDAIFNCQTMVLPEGCQCEPGMVSCVGASSRWLPCTQDQVQDSRTCHFCSAATCGNSLPSLPHSVDEWSQQYGSIGWSVGATLGLAVGGAAVGRRVLACIGDGSFQMVRCCIP